MGGLPTRSGVGGKISGVNFDDFELESQRLRLRPWRWSDGDDFARMNADAAVMADLGGPLSRAANATLHLKPIPNHRQEETSVLAHLPITSGDGGTRRPAFWAVWPADRPAMASALGRRGEAV